MSVEFNQGWFLRQLKAVEENSGRWDTNESKKPATDETMQSSGKATSSPKNSPSQEMDVRQ